MYNKDEAKKELFVFHSGLDKLQSWSKNSSKLEKDEVQFADPDVEMGILQLPVVFPEKAKKFNISTSDVES